MSTLSGISPELKEKRTKKDILKQQENDKDFKDNTKNNHNFFTIYRENMPELRWLMKKNGLASSMLNFIMEHMDNTNTLICSYQIFIDYFSVSKDTVRRCIKILYENGFVDILKSGTSNLYIVNNDVAWTDWSNQKGYCKLQGNMLVSQVENKNYKYKNQFDKFKELRLRENIKE